MKFAQRLQIIRKANKLTQEELGAIIDKNRSTIAGYETERREPDYDTLKKISDFYDVSIDYLLGKTDIPKPKVVSDNNQKLSIRIHDMLLDKGIITEDEELSEEKIEWLKKILGQAIDLSRM